jgi:hypothetical protein
MAYDGQRFVLLDLQVYAFKRVTRATTHLGHHPDIPQVDVTMGS